MMIVKDPPGQDVRSLALLAHAAHAPHIHIALDAARAEQIMACLAFFAPQVEVAYLPAWDCLPYDRVGPHAEVTAGRLAALSCALSWMKQEAKPRIFLTTARAAVQRLPPPDFIAKAVFTITAETQMDIGALEHFCIGAGYTRVPTVREAGQWARRGGIIDIFPPGQSDPVRIDLFGDIVESVRSFDAATQLGYDPQRQSITLRAAAEYALSLECITRFRNGWRAHCGHGAGVPVYEAISEGRNYKGVEHWLPLFHETMAGLLDYVPHASVSFDPGAAIAGKEHIAQAFDFYTARQDLAGRSSIDAAPPLSPEALYMSQTQWSAFSVADKDIGQEGCSLPPFAPKEGDMFAPLRILLEKEYTDKVLLIAAYSKGSAQRLGEMLVHAGLPTVHMCSDINGALLGQMNMALLPIEHGFATQDLILVTECDLLGAPLTRPPKKSKKHAQDFLTELSTLTPGDLIVHIDHGVGRFVALETLAVGKAFYDCLKVEYAGGDRLFVPVTNMDLLSRFGSSDAGGVLDKLGGVAWQARKAAARRNVLEIAADLMAQEGARRARGCEPLSIDSDTYAAFAARFPYAETDDQTRAIADVLEDMKGNHPMDRLICGDVGFGKTEVAMRAAFVAARAGAQVAVIVPTTLLARQHFETFVDRFKNTDIKIANLSRMISPKEAAKVKAGLADGSVSIVIGTHALLSDTIRFVNLGLSVIDEEQHFGVTQKEKLKSLREGVHVLSLSATPIPRTLHMALSSVRAMSVIATPPIDRIAIRSFVAPFDLLIVREALMREYARGGQSFVVCPRVADIPPLAETLQDLVPGLKVITAHGQMSPRELEACISAFYEGRGDILLATPIIESGLDVPRANTLIVHRADMFGLAQLYQIRGRVGRSAARAYAYLTYEGALTESAQKRLAVMETLDSLGAGFQLASHDLDIRGAGNLLGAQQSGHVREVGIELYQHMLAEAIATAKEGRQDVGELTNEGFSPQIKIGVTALLPQTYIPETTLRMSLYRRLTEARQQDEREALAAELIDRFGPLPREVQNLLCILEIKALAHLCGLARVEAGGQGALLVFHPNHMPKNLERLVAWATQTGARLRPDSTISIPGSWTMSERLKHIKSVLKSLYHS